MVRIRYRVEADITGSRMTGGTGRSPSARITFSPGRVSVNTIGGRTYGVVTGIGRAAGMAEVTVAGMNIRNNVIIANCMTVDTGAIPSKMGSFMTTVGRAGTRAPQFRHVAGGAVCRGIRGDY